jgi:hypothetical protein
MPQCSSSFRVHCTVSAFENHSPKPTKGASGIPPIPFDPTSRQASSKFTFLVAQQHSSFFFSSWLICDSLRFLVPAPSQCQLFFYAP